MRNRFLVLLSAVAVVVAAFNLVPDPAFGQARTDRVTFNKDVLPILQKNCQSCHRPGEIGPMSFLTYEATRPWAKAIKEAVLAKKMPPWFADPRFGHFENDRRLSVPQYSYLWQTIYVQQEAIELPKGTRIDVYAHWDNSQNNPHRADSTKTVRWGDQSWDEMLVAFLGVIVEPKTDARKLITMRPPAASRE